MSEGRVAGIVSGLGLVAAAVAYLSWEIGHRGTYLYDTAIYPVSDADEWRYTACSRLVEHGYALFTQVFSAQPPLLFLSLAGSMSVTSDSIAGARWAEIAFGLVGLAATAVIAWLLGGRWAAVVAAVVLAASPGFLLYSHMIEAEGPQMALTTLALMLCLVSVRQKSWPVAAIGGLALAAAILVKLFAVEAFLPALWLLWFHSEKPRHATVAFGLAAIIPVGFEFALVAPRAQWQQVVSMHNAAAAANITNVTPPFTVLTTYLGLDAGLTILAVVGALVLALKRDWDALTFFALWPGVTIIMLYLFRPLFPHHPAILATGLAALAGVGIGRALDEPFARPISFLALAGAAAYVALIPRLAHADRHLLVAGRSSQIVSLARFADRHSPPGAIVAADDLAVADTANRLVPPPLCDPSNVRLQSGYLAPSTAIGAVRRYKPALVIPSSGLYQQIPGFLPWVARHYSPVRAPDGVTAYSRK